jgi:hypothetical protein
MDILRREKRGLRRAPIAPGFGLVLTKCISTTGILNINRLWNDHPIGSRCAVPGPGKHHNVTFETSVWGVFHRQRWSNRIAA